MTGINPITGMNAIYLLTIIHPIPVLIKTTKSYTLIHNPDLMTEIIMLISHLVRLLLFTLLLFIYLIDHR